VIANGWLNCMLCDVLGCSAWICVCARPEGCPFGPTDCIVVNVVVKDRTEGDGDEKVLSPPLRDSMPPFAVLLVPAKDGAPCEGAISERGGS
jgi:hypothetical protein